jgi:hypothetical protein
MKKTDKPFEFTFLKYPPPLLFTILFWKIVYGSDFLTTGCRFIKILKDARDMSDYKSDRKTGTAFFNPHLSRLARTSSVAFGGFLNEFTCLWND